FAEHLQQLLLGDQAARQGDLAREHVGVLGLLDDLPLLGVVDEAEVHHDLADLAAAGVAGRARLDGLGQLGGVLFGRLARGRFGGRVAGGGGRVLGCGGRAAVGLLGGGLVRGRLVAGGLVRGGRRLGRGRGLPGAGGGRRLLGGGLVAAADELTHRGLV